MLPIRIGGLMRCCIQTLNARAAHIGCEGASLECDACDGGMIVSDGAWEWIAPDSLRHLRETQATPRNGVK